MISRSMLGDLNNALEKVADSQKRITSEKKIEKPSDNAAATEELLTLKTRIRETTQYNSNIAGAMLTLGEADSSVGAVSDMLMDAKQLSMQAEGVSSAETRAILAAKVENLIKNMADQCNTLSGGEYLFAGTRTASVPFAITTGDDSDGKSRVQSVTYSGGDVSPSLDISAAEKTALSCTGSEVAGSGADGIFGTLISIRKAIIDGTTTTELQDKLDKHMSRLDGIQSDLGCRQEYLVAVRGRYTQGLSDLEARRSSLEDVDLAEEAVLNTQADTAYQAALAAVAKQKQSSLANYL